MYRCIGFDIQYVMLVDTYERNETYRRVGGGGDYAFFCLCVDSDFALLEMYHNGKLVEKSAIGEPELLAEIDELADMSTPDLTLWEPLLQNPEDAHALQTALIEETDYQNEQFALIHPGGAVGERLNKH